MTTTTTLPLNTQAQAMLKDLVRQAGPLSKDIEQAVTQAAQKPAQTAATDSADGVAQVGTVVALDCEQLEKVLLQAMPNQKKQIEAAKAQGLCYHPDKTNGRFLTQILSMRIEKETENAYSPPRPVAPRVVDPLYASFTMAPDADVMLLFNARDVDDKGQPLLMKVVARDHVDTSTLDLSRYRTQANNTPDIVKVDKGASYVETKDIHEAEFAFGDPLKQVSLNSKGQEISTSVWVRPENVDRQRFFRVGANGRIDRNRPETRFDRQTTGDNLDRTPVKTFEDKIGLRLETQNLPAGAWLDTPNAGAAVKASLEVGRGYMFEPGATASVAVSGHASATVSLGVDKNDAHLLGNAPVSAALNIGAASTLRQVFQSRVTLSAQAQAQGSDRANTQKTIGDTLFADRAERIVGGAALTPFGDRTTNAAALAAARMSCTAKPLPRDPEEDGVKISLELGAGFLAAKDGSDVSFKDWKIVVGYQDVDGTWKEEVRTVQSDASKKEAFSLEIGDFDGLQKKNGNIEVRLFSDAGVPAQRWLVPFREVHWG